MLEKNVPLMITAIKRGYEWIISKNEMDKDTSKAALLLIELKDTNITSQLENQIGKIAQALAIDVICSNTFK